MDYQTFLLKKYKLSLAIAVIQNKPHDQTVKQYVKQLNNEIKTKSKRNYYKNDENISKVDVSNNNQIEKVLLDNIDEIRSTEADCIPINDYHSIKISETALRITKNLNNNMSSCDDSYKNILNNSTDVTCNEIIDISSDEGDLINSVNKRKCLNKPVINKRIVYKKVNKKKKKSKKDVSDNILYDFAKIALKSEIYRKVSSSYVDNIEKSTNFTEIYSQNIEKSSKVDIDSKNITKTTNSMCAQNSEIPTEIMTLVESLKKSTNETETFVENNEKSTKATNSSKENIEKPAILSAHPILTTNYDNSTSEERNNSSNSLNHKDSIILISVDSNKRTDYNSYDFSIKLEINNNENTNIGIFCPQEKLKLNEMENCENKNIQNAIVMSDQIQRSVYAEESFDKCEIFLNSQEINEKLNSSNINDIQKNTSESKNTFDQFTKHNDDEDMTLCLENTVEFTQDFSKYNISKQNQINNNIDTIYTNKENINDPKLMAEKNECYVEFEKNIQNSDVLTQNYTLDSEILKQINKTNDLRQFRRKNETNHNEEITKKNSKISKNPIIISNKNKFIPKTGLVNDITQFKDKFNSDLIQINAKSYNLSNNDKNSIQKFDSAYNSHYNSSKSIDKTATFTNDAKKIISSYKGNTNIILNNTNITQMNETEIIKPRKRNYKPKEKLQKPRKYIRKVDKKPKHINMIYNLDKLQNGDKITTNFLRLPPIQEVNTDPKYILNKTQNTEKNLKVLECNTNLTSNREITYNTNLTQNTNDYIQDSQPIYGNQNMELYLHSKNYKNTQSSATYSNLEATPSYSDIYTRETVSYTEKERCPSNYNDVTSLTPQYTNVTPNYSMDTIKLKCLTSNDSNVTANSSNDTSNNNLGELNYTNAKSNIKNATTTNPKVAINSTYVTSNCPTLNSTSVTSNQTYVTSNAVSYVNVTTTPVSSTNVTTKPEPSTNVTSNCTNILTNGQNYPRSNNLIELDQATMKMIDDSLLSDSGLANDAEYGGQPSQDIFMSAQCQPLHTNVEIIQDDLSQEINGFLQVEPESDQRILVNSYVVPLQSDVSSIKYKVIHSLNTIKKYLSGELSNDDGFESASTLYSSWRTGSQFSGYSSNKFSDRMIKINENALDLLNYINTNDRMNLVSNLTYEIADNLCQLIDKMHSDNMYADFIADCISSLKEHFNMIGSYDEFNLEKFLQVQDVTTRILLLNKSVHLNEICLGLVSEKLRKFYENFTEDDGKPMEIANIDEIEKLHHYIHLTKSILNEYSLKSRENSQKKCESMEVDDSLDIASRISTLWRNKFEPKLETDIKTPIKANSSLNVNNFTEILSKFVVNFMEKYPLIAYECLKCYNLLQANKRM